VLQVIGQRSEHLPQLQRWEGLNNLCGRRAFSVVDNNGIERHAAARDVKAVIYLVNIRRNRINHNNSSYTKSSKPVGQAARRAPRLPSTT
jgi:hypothetical protein